MKKLILFFLLVPIFSYCENRRTQADSCLNILKTSKEDTNKVKTLNYLSGCYIEMDLYDSALLYSAVAEQISLKLAYMPGLAAAFRKMGVTHIQTGDYPKALDYLFKSMRINEKLNNKEEIFMLNNNLGTVYCLQRDYDTALQYFYRANDYKKSDAFTLANIGWAYLQKQSYTSSLSYYKKAIKQYGQNKNGIANCLNAIGTVYEYQEENDSALTYYKKSLQLKGEIEDNQGICDCLGGIGDIYFKMQKHNEAIKYQLQALSLAKKIGYTISVKQTEEALSKIYEKSGKLPQALEHYKNFIAYRDSMYNEQNTKKSVKTEMDFKFDKEREVAKVKRDKENALLEQKIKNNREQRNLFIVGFVIILMASIAIFFAYKKTTKQKDIIEVKKKEVEHKTKELTDNMEYASKIQKAILPSDKYLQSEFVDNFVIYKPKDIVSGDFYWAYRDSSTYYFATADCTGHGVSGAMMSMMGANLLNEIVIERGITSPEKILDTLRSEVIKALNQKGSEQERKDGMDISFCKLYKDGISTNYCTLEYAGANNPVYIVRNGEAIEIKPNKFPVSKYGELSPFKLNTIDLKLNDIIYTFSDGVVDQFGGEKGKKLMSKRFREWITELSNLTMRDIGLRLEQRFDKWKGNTEQTDDVTVFAIKV